VFETALNDLTVLQNKKKRETKNKKLPKNTVDQIIIILPGIPP
jgi:hypothetical protein